MHLANKCTEYLNSISNDGDNDLMKDLKHFQSLTNQNNFDSIDKDIKNCIESMHNEKNMNKTIQYYLNAASKNDINVIFNLGKIYYEGIHIDRDIKKAV